VSANAAADVTARLRRIRASAATEAPAAAVKAMSLLGIAATAVELTRYSHPPLTRTPSPPGGSPARITGTLGRSLVATPPLTKAGWASTTIGGTVIYARIQELGGVINAKTSKGLFWIDEHGGHRAKSVRIPARPYLGPTTAKLVASGRLGDVATKAWLAALRF
jgi:phage gpG-like protein